MILKNDAVIPLQIIDDIIRMSMLNNTAKNLLLKNMEVIRLKLILLGLQFNFKIANSEYKPKNKTAKLNPALILKLLYPKRIIFKIIRRLKTEFVFAKNFTRFFCLSANIENIVIANNINTIIEIKQAFELKF